MIGGGVQHFTDFPIYSSYLIPLGVIISLIAFLLKNNFVGSSKSWLTLLGIFFLISIMFHFGLMSYANSLIIMTKENCISNIAFGIIKVDASGGHGDEKCAYQNKTSTQSSNNTVIGMTNDSIKMTKDSVVYNDRTFIEYVIPHHQDAIDSSTKVLATTQDSELKAFVSNVIKT
jgi:uncharacterized protein (DUF305 family)